MEASHLLAVGAELGEGPIWFDDALWFVDIKGCRIYRHDMDGRTGSWETPEMVGWIVPSAISGLIAGLRSGPHRFDPAHGSFQPIGAVDQHLPGNRLNDAAVDARGRLFFGTMDNAETAASGSVFMLDCGEVRPTGIAPTQITNGPAIAPAGDRLYHVDTLARTVTAHRLAPDGMPDDGAPFLRFDERHGYPDGAVCDAQGGIWIGFYGGWCARRFGPDGVMTDEVRFPVANVTKVALGGPDGRTAFATTARQGLDAAALDAQPLAGDIFTFKVEVPAAPVMRANS